MNNKTHSFNDSLFIYHGDCLNIMKKLKQKFNVVLTSPPYNTQRNLNDRTYDLYQDMIDDKEYLNFSLKVFKEYEKLLEKNGVILYNLSYGNENPVMMFEVINTITNKTKFMIADIIVWKKKSAMPNNMSHNKLTRIVEFIFVICRKNEYKTFQSNREVSSIRKSGQKTYKIEYNFVEAKNNDGSNNLNKCTYSTELCEKLLKIYARPNDWILDNFLGTGTTLCACFNLKLNGVGIELSEQQYQYSINRISKIINN
ncbi:site-specific DNA-methyltransferase [Mycoplasma sp. E35C]|uniref:DNA-methyltransferase n=1 Tax=Mycoplasma sp. E35C TaxID=2801918 RepID=UPI001CA3D3EB|nr:site-specific DNA-methyltransferase [Mycoplasma sp. E35C]QZX49090.1 site-specific DNA-methyltransferase [Mycoplasma sp. E35C]